MENPGSDICLIDSSIAQLIDRNYYPIKNGIEISDKGDAIKARWKNDDFDRLCSHLKSLKISKTTDIIFYLLDFSGEARENLIAYITKIKQQTLRDKKSHNFSMPPDDAYVPRVGITYISSSTNSIEELRNSLLTLCQVRKYKCKGDVWIGFGSIINSSNMIDVVIFNDQKWKYDAALEEKSKIMLEGPNQGRLTKIDKKICRNEKCPCGSGFKYKKCCGK